MHKPLFAFCGPSGSGKTSVADELKKDGYEQLSSYTTRPKRTENEIGHTFVTDDEFNQLTNIIAYTEYNGFKYAATSEQVDEADIYVIDPDGIKTLLQKYQTKRPIYVVYFDTTVATRIDRMVARGDSDMQIISRLRNDEQYDWYKKISNICWDLGKKRGLHIDIIAIDANQKLQNVVKQVKEQCILW